MLCAMGINTGRVLGGGLLAGAVMNFVDFLVNGVWLMQRWQDEATALNPRLMDPANSTPSMIGWIVTDFLFGLLIVWSYAAMRPRFGPRRRHGREGRAARLDRLAHRVLLLRVPESLQPRPGRHDVGRRADCRAGGRVRGLLDLQRVRSRAWDA
jgi:hypothetical protein